MFANLKNVLKVPDLRNKILFTSGDGRPVPPRRERSACPASTPARSTQLQEQARVAGCHRLPQPVLRRCARAASPSLRLGIMPYITASASSCRSSAWSSPSWRSWQHQGAVGQRKITQWTRYLAIGHRHAAGHRPDLHLRPRAAAVRCSARTAPNVQLLPDGTSACALPDDHHHAGRRHRASLMWIGELISQRGIGNGMSMLIFCLGRQPPRRTPTTRSSAEGAGSVFAVLLVVSACVIARRHRAASSWASAASPCSSPSAWSAGAMYGGQSTYIPLKVNQSRRRSRSSSPARCCCCRCSSPTCSATSTERLAPSLHAVHQQVRGQPDQPRLTC